MNKQGSTGPWTAPAILITGFCIPVLFLSCESTETGDRNRVSSHVSSVWTHPDLAGRRRVRVPLDHSAAIVWLPAPPSSNAPSFRPDQKQTLLNDLVHLSVFQNWQFLNAVNSVDAAQEKARNAGARMLLVLQPGERKTEETSAPTAPPLSVRVRLFDLQLDKTHPILKGSFAGGEHGTAPDEDQSYDRAWWKVRAKIVASLMDWHDRVERN